MEAMTGQSAASMWRERERQARRQEKREAQAERRKTKRRRVAHTSQASRAGGIAMTVVDGFPDDAAAT
jgi:hypothetical protein